MTDHSNHYTHGYHDSVVRAHNNRTIENSAHYCAHLLQPGLNLLDVGSGAGTITADFAKRLAPGRVTALEVEDAALALTRAHIQRLQLPNVELVVGDVQQLGFPDNSFDIVHAHQVLQHVNSPVQALREMRRVCKPGGIIAARDADYAGFIWYPQPAALDQWMTLYQGAARANGGEPNAGRMLLSWAQQAGLRDITASSSTWCLATPAARDWWGSMWSERILHSKIAQQLRATGTSQHQLNAISLAWKSWAAADNGWMSIPHGEILCRV